MSETKKNDKVLDSEELVDYTAPLLPGKAQQDIVCIVNGESIRIKRGVPVKIKRKYYEALTNAARQQYAAYTASEKLSKQQEPVKM